MLFGTTTSTKLETLMKILKWTHFAKIFFGNTFVMVWDMTVTLSLVNGMILKDVLLEMLDLTQTLVLSQLFTMLNLWNLIIINSTIMEVIVKTDPDMVELLFHKFHTKILQKFQSLTLLAFKMILPIQLILKTLMIKSQLLSSTIFTTIWTTKVSQWELTCNTLETLSDCFHSLTLRHQLCQLKSNSKPKKLLKLLFDVVIFDPIIFWKN